MLAYLSGGLTPWGPISVPKRPVRPVGTARTAVPGVPGVCLRL